MALPRTVTRLALLSLVLALAAGAARADLLLEENFDYATGQLTLGNAGTGQNVSGGNWTWISGTQVFLSVSGGSLGYAGYPSSGTGNKVEIVSTSQSAEDAYRAFSQYQRTGSTVYASFLINVANATGLAANSHTNGDYFAALVPVTGTTVFVNRVSIRQGTVANTFNLGLRATSSNASADWGAADLDVGTTYLVVMRYQLIAGGSNDVAALFINPSLAGGEPAPDLVQTSGLASDPDSIGRFLIREGTGTGLATPNAAIDGIRVGTTWGDIVGALPPNPVVLSTVPANNASGVLTTASVTVTFDRLMDAATIDTASFALAGVRQARYYPDSIRPLTNSASFTFYVRDSLRRRDTITATVSAAVADTGGNAMLAPYSWTFATELPSNPAVTGTSPANNAANVPTGSAISVTFNRLINAATVDSASFAVSGLKQAVYRADSIRPLANSASFTFYVRDSLRKSDTVTVTLSTAIADTLGQQMLAPYSWQFFTVLPDTTRPLLASNAPAAGQDYVAVNTAVVLNFSEALLPASATAAAFSVTGRRTAQYAMQPPILSNGNTRVTLLPAADFSYRDTVTVRVLPSLTDAAGNAIRDTSFSFSTKLRPGVTIRDVQYTTDPSGNSPYAGQSVTISGVVTGVVRFGSSTGMYFIQDGPGPWNGVYCYDRSRNPSLGDSVAVTGTVIEYNGLTELSPVSGYSLLKRGAALPAPVVLPTDSFSAANPMAEAYEGVLVATRKVSVTALPNSYNEWQVSDGSGPCIIDDFLDTMAHWEYTPVVGDSLIRVQGIFHSSFGWKILPRSRTDVVQFKPVKLISTLPANGMNNVPTQVGVRLYFDKPLDLAATPLSCFSVTGSRSGPHTLTGFYSSSSYRIRLVPAPAFQPGETVSVWVSHAVRDTFGWTLDGNGDGVGANDSTDDVRFSFATLLNPTAIAEVQRPGPDGFTPRLVGQVVTVEGVVTGPDYVFTSSTSSTASSYVQDATGGVNVYGGSVGSFDLGRRVVVTGTVTEYNGVTEVAAGSGGTIALWDLADALPAPRAFIYNQFPTEEVEGLLIQFDGSVSSPPSYAGGGYNMEVRNGQAAIAIRFGESAGFDRTVLTYGRKVRVIGIVSQYDKEPPYDAGYQIVPRMPEPYEYNGVTYPADITVLADTVPAANDPIIAAASPNPFAPDLGEVMRIDLNSPVDHRLTLRVYDLKGRLVKTLLNNVPGGHQTALWNGGDNFHRRATIGMYILHLRSVTFQGAVTDRTMVVVLGTPLK